MSRFEAALASEQFVAMWHKVTILIQVSALADSSLSGRTDLDCSLDREQTRGAAVVLSHWHEFGFGKALCRVLSDASGISLRQSTTEVSI